MTCLRTTTLLRLGRELTISPEQPWLAKGFGLQWTGSYRMLFMVAG